MSRGCCERCLYILARTFLSCSSTRCWLRACGRVAVARTAILGAGQLHVHMWSPFVFGLHFPPSLTFPATKPDTTAANSATTGPRPRVPVPVPTPSDRLSAASCDGGSGRSLHGDLRRRPPYQPMMNRLKEAILPFDPQRPEGIVPPSRRARASSVGFAFALGAVTGLGTLNIVHYLVFLIVALVAGLSVNHSVPGLSMILNMAPFRHGGERTGRWLRNMLTYTVGAVAATTAVGWVLGYLGSMLPRSWSSDSYGLAALGALAALSALREPPVVSLPAPQWWTQLAAWRRSRYRQLIESDPFGGLIGEVCGTFVPNAMISGNDGRCGLIRLPPPSAPSCSGCTVHIAPVCYGS